MLSSIHKWARVLHSMALTTSMPVRSPFSAQLTGWLGWVPIVKLLSTFTSSANLELMKSYSESILPCGWLVKKVKKSQQQLTVAV